jgi:transglutaminase-like putative cysteine protease
MRVCVGCEFVIDYQAYQQRRGVCRDFAHIAVMFCRAMNIPARYAFGYLPDIGRPFDPTNHRRAGLSSITIAVGCDYHDVSPTSGSFIAPYQGQLTARKRAGLTRIEYAVV